MQESDKLADEVEPILTLSLSATYTCGFARANNRGSPVCLRSRVIKEEFSDENRTTPRTSK